jgi:hypothetical protein
MTLKTGNPLARPWAVADAGDANSLFRGRLTACGRFACRSFLNWPCLGARLTDPIKERVYQPARRAR